MNTIQNFSEMIVHLQGRKDKKQVAAVCPYDEGTQGALQKAIEAGFIKAVLIGERAKIEPAFAQYEEQVEYVEAGNADEAALKAVMLCREGKAQVMMKGLLNTDDLLRAILNKEQGLLEKGRVLTHVTCTQIPGYDKLLFVSDVAVIPYPTAQQRVEQLRYLLSLCRSMGVAEPRVGLVNCTEKVNPKHFPFTAEYRELIAQAESGEFGPCIVDGPLDLKTCLSAHALHKKGIVSPLEGHADALIFPDIQAGNVFYKTITLFTEAQTAAILCGPQVPVVLPSRGDSIENKFYSIAMASL